jgi:Trk K+ transport system NAD-binding subunit
VVCGDDPLAHSLANELTNRYGADVTVILPSRRRNYGPQLAALRKVKVVEAERLDEDAFRAAKLTQASGLALVGQDDIGNIHAALCAQELHPRVRLVIRMFSTSLGEDVRQLFRDCAVLSDAAMAAPELVAAALGEVAPGFVQLPGRTLYVALRTQVHARDVVCGIATTSGAGPPEVLPADDRAANLVLAVAGPRQGPAPAARRLRRRTRRRARRRRQVMALSRALLSVVDSKLEITLLVLVAVLVAGVVAIGVIDGIPPWQALYTTLITAADAGGPDLQAGLARQLAQAAVAVVGIALVPVLTAVVVNASVNARLATVMGRLRQPMAGHVVVVGLGDVGTRVIRFLHELGHEVVAIDQSDSSRGALVARELDIPLIVGDASRDETLRQASVRTCRALLALSSSDVNLGAALRARAILPELRLVLRVLDDDFARRVEQVFEIPNTRSVSALAASAFAAALLEREVIGTIAVHRRVLVIAELPVAAGAELDGGQLAEVDTAGEVRVIAVTAERDPKPTWTPPPGTPIRAGDRLLVIANRTGLSRVLARTTGP